MIIEKRIRKLLTEDEALDKFKQLLNDDPKFSDQWFDCDPDFYEWCSLYDDTKHIKQKGDK